MNQAYHKAMARIGGGKPSRFIDKIGRFRSFFFGCLQAIWFNRNSWNEPISTNRAVVMQLLGDLTKVTCYIGSQVNIA